MKRVAALWALSSLAILLVAAPCAMSAGVVRQYKVPNRFPEDLPSSNLSVYLPGDYETSGVSYPVLYLIHGAGGDDRTFFGHGYSDRAFMGDVDAGAIADTLIREGKTRPLIIACPDMGMSSQFDENLLSDMVLFVDRTFRTIPRRESRAIAGHSLGGFRSLNMILRRPELFSLAGGFATGFRASETLLRNLALDQAQSPVSFWLYAGTADEFGLAPTSRSLVGDLQRIGLPVEYIEDDGDHTSRIARRLPEFLEFASAHLGKD